ncbi:hypothetical protein PB16LOC_04564 [Pectobacterium versatile]|nr:hypothetical protein PB16LOC_04564 [Pectobacterium versatile]
MGTNPQRRQPPRLPRQLQRRQNPFDHGTLAARIVTALYRLAVHRFRRHLPRTVIGVFHHRIRAGGFGQPAGHVIRQFGNAVGFPVRFLCGDERYPPCRIMLVVQRAAIRCRTLHQTVCHIVLIAVHPPVVMPFLTQPTAGVKAVRPVPSLTVRYSGELRFRVIVVAYRRPQRVGRFQQVIKRPVAELVTLPQRIRHRRQVTFHIVTKLRLAAVFMRINSPK